MKISKAEINLRRLLDHLPQQTNKHKLVHYVATLRELLFMLEQENGQQELPDGKGTYRESIEEFAKNFDVSRNADLWECSTTDDGLGPSHALQTLASGNFSVTQSTLFPPGLRRKHSPSSSIEITNLAVKLGRSGEVVADDDYTEYGNLRNSNDLYELCVDLQGLVLTPAGSEVPSPPSGFRHNHLPDSTVGHDDLDPEIWKSELMTHEYDNQFGNGSNSDDLLLFSVSLQGLGLTNPVSELQSPSSSKTSPNSSVGKEFLGLEFERLTDVKTRQDIRKYQVAQGELVDEMLLLTRQIKETSLLLENSLHDTEQLLRSSEHTIRQCLSVTTSANLQTGQLFAQTQKRRFRFVTGAVLLLMYLIFVLMVLVIRII